MPQSLHVRCEAVLRLLPLVTPSEGVGFSRIFRTPLEGVELPQFLYVRCEAVLRLLPLVTPSEGVGFPGIFRTPLEGVGFIPGQMA